MGIGDWGLGIGDWANPQSPIPNPQNLESNDIILLYSILTTILYKIKSVFPYFIYKI
jgi:hypothetical protein